MDCPRDQLFPGAAFAANQDGSRSGRNLGDEIGDFSHLGISANDEVAFRVGFQLPQGQLIFVFEGLGFLPGFDEIPNETGSIAADQFGLSGFALINVRGNIGIARDIDDEVGGFGCKELTVAGAHRQAELASQHQTRCALILVGHPNDFDAWVLVEQFHQSPAAGTGPD